MSEGPFGQTGFLRLPPTLENVRVRNHFFNYDRPSPEVLEDAASILADYFIDLDTMQAMLDRDLNGDEDDWYTPLRSAVKYINSDDPYISELADMACTVVRNAAEIGTSA